MNRRRHSTRRSKSAAEALSQLSLFAGCSRADLDCLLADIDFVFLPADTTIDRTGTRARQFVGILNGCVRGSDPSGRTFVLGPGDHFAARELLADEPHSATYESSTTVVLVSVFGATFRSQVREMPGLVDRACVHRDSHGTVGSASH